MSLITRCPACETLFKVVPDQLRISDGWVRCGQCDEIFDASLHLSAAVPEVGTPVMPVPAMAANSEATDAPDTPAQPLDIDLNTDLGDAPSDFSTPVPLRPALDAALADSDDFEPDLAGGLRDVSFLRESRTDSFWRKPLMRATLGFLSGMLLLGLVGQIVFHERDRLAAAQPSLKPWLLTFCGVLDCTVSPLRRIEAIVIESSSFSNLGADSYRLNFTLKNSAATALAVPALELTMTDALDQPVARRVLLPVELGLQSDTLEAGAEWPASVVITVKAGTAAERVVGYRLFVFYP